MEFTFESRYDQRAMTAMARALRKTARRNRSRRSHIFGWLVVALGLLMALLSPGVGRAILNGGLALMIAAALIFEDSINGYVARRRMPSGTEQAHVVFREEEFVSTTDLGATAFRYDKIQEIVEDRDYFVFLFDRSHGQVYDKGNMSGGTPEDFRRFLEAVTGKTVHQL